MQRTDTLDALKRLAPALDSKDLVPVFTCFCFDGTTATTYDGVVALSLPLDFGGVRGAVRGKLLLDFLNASRAADLAVSSDNGQLLVKAGRSKLDTPMLPAKDFVFIAPDAKGKSLPVEKPLIAGLAKAMLSLGRDPGHPWRQGVTVSLDGQGGATLYACDNTTATRVKVELKGSSEKLFTILPPKFCELLADAAKTDKPKALRLAKEWAVCEFESGLRLFSRSVQATEALKTYRSMFEIVGEAKDKLADIPKGLERCLERAAAVLPYAKHPYTKAVVGGGKLKLETRSDAGNVEDSVTCDGLPEISVRMNPLDAMRGLPSATKFGFTEAAVVYTAPGFAHLLTTIKGAEES